MLLESKQERFLAKRVAIFALILIIIDLIFIKVKWFALCGLVIGSLLSILKLASYAMVFTKIIFSQAGDNKNKFGAVKTLLNFVINQIIVILALFISIKVNLWLFIGFAAGVLLVPFVIMVNILSEALKITHNNFE